MSRKKTEPMQSLAESFASIAQSLREYVDLYRANSDRESGKLKRPTVFKVSQATYQRDESKEYEVPGFRRTLGPSSDKAQRS